MIFSRKVLIFFLIIFLNISFAKADIWKSPSFTYYQKAVTYYNKRDIKTSCELLIKAVKECPNNIPALYLLGDIYQKLKEYDNALRYYKQVLRLYPRFNELRLKIAKIYYLKKEFFDAELMYKDALKHDPQNKKILWDMVLLAKDMGDSDKEEIYLNKLIALDNKDTRAIIELSSILEKKNEIDKEIEVLSKGYRDTSDVDIGKQLAYLLFHNGKIDKAMHIFDELIKKDVSDPDIFCAMGIISYQKKRDDDALRYLQKAIKLRPNFFEALYNIGILYANKEEIQKAIKYLKRCVEIRPDAPEPYERLAELYELSIQPELAKEMRKKAKTLRTSIHRLP